MHITICKDDVIEYDECGTVESILRFVLLLSLLLSLVYGVKQTGVTYHQHTAVVTAAPGPPGHQQSPVYWTPGSHNSGLETKVNNFIAESSVSQWAVTRGPESPVISGSLALRAESVMICYCHDQSVPSRTMTMTAFSPAQH